MEEAALKNFIQNVLEDPAAIPSSKRLPTDVANGAIPVWDVRKKQWVGKKQPLAEEAFTAYTPSWRGQAVNPTLNDGTLTGRYQRFGNAVLCQVTLVIGPSTLGGTGAWSFSLPVSGLGVVYLGTARVFDTSAGAFYACLSENDASDIFVLTAAQPGAFIAPGVPIAWAAGDTVVLTHFYEAA